MIIREHIDCFPPFAILSTLEASSVGFQSLEFPFRWEIWLTDFQLNTRSCGWLRRLSFILRQPLDHPPVTTDPRLMSDPVSAIEQVSISRRRGRWNSSPFPWCSLTLQAIFGKHVSDRFIPSTIQARQFFSQSACSRKTGEKEGKENRGRSWENFLSLFFFHSLTDVASWIIYIVPAFIKQFLRPERGGKNRRNKN